MRVELHCHSTCSDGALAPADIAARASARKVSLFALTDHDTCAGTDAALVPAAHVVRGTEISCDDGHGTVHVLAYDTGGAWELLMARLAEVQIARRSRLRKMAARLGQRGIVVNVEELLLRSDGRAVGRPDLARALVEQGVVRTIKEAFSKHLFDGGPVDVPHEGLSLAEALAVGLAAGARMSLAHPHLYRDRTIPMLRKYRDAGLTGLECIYGHYGASERSQWRKTAHQFNMVVTGGSDFHAPGDPEPGVEFPDDEAAVLTTWLGVC